MDDKLKEMLDVDVSKIAEEGKKSNRSKLQKIIVFTVLAITIGIAVHFGLKESAYKKAYTLADEGNYTEAIVAFENLKGYRDSKKNAEKATLAEKFMDSTVRNTQSVQLSKGLSRYKTVFADVDFDTSFDWRTETFIIQISSDNLSKSDMEVTDELTSAILPSFMSLCHDIDKNSQSIQTACKVSGGYSVDCSIECIGTDGELLYSSLNGEEKTSCIDIAATEDKLYGPSYQKMVDAVDTENYAQCCSIWDTLNANGYYRLSYKDISDYYYYAKVMSAYISSEAVSLSQLQSDLNNVSGDFKDAKDVRTKIAEIAESAKTALNGTYHKDSCELEIGSESLSWKIVSGSEKGNSLSAKIDDYFIKNGKISQAHAVEENSDGQEGINVTKTDSGVKVTFDNSDDDAKYGGSYLPGSAPVEVKATKTSNASSTSVTTKNGVIFGTSKNPPANAVPLTDSAIQGTWKSNVYNETDWDYQYFITFSNGKFTREHYNYIYEEYIQHNYNNRESVDIGSYYIDGANIVVTYQNHSLWYNGVVSGQKTEVWPVSYVHSGGIRFQNKVGGCFSYYRYE